MLACCPTSNWHCKQLQVHLLLTVSVTVMLAVVCSTSSVVLSSSLSKYVCIYAVYLISPCSSFYLSFPATSLLYLCTSISFLPSIPSTRLYTLPSILLFCLLSFLFPIVFFSSSCIPSACFILILLLSSHPLTPTYSPSLSLCTSPPTISLYLSTLTANSRPQSLTSGGHKISPVTPPCPTSMTPEMCNALIPETKALSSFSSCVPRLHLSWQAATVCHLRLLSDIFMRAHNVLCSK